MTKAELQAAKEVYDLLMVKAQASIREGRHAHAVSIARQAWEHVDAMMKYERRWEDREFQSVPCIDLVLRFAPLLFDTDSLDALSELLKDKRSIDRAATDDLAARLDDARRTLRQAHRLWNHIELHAPARQRDLRSALGDEQDEWRHIIDRWVEMGVIARVPDDAGSYFLRLATNMSEPARGRCAECGRAVRGPKYGMLSAQQCPACEQTVWFVLLPDLIAHNADKEP